MNYSEAMMKLANSVNDYFDTVYFDAEIVVNDKSEKFPAISQGDEWINLCPTDQRETVYIRRNGADEVQTDLKISSCAKAYLMRTPIRVVYFKDHAKDHAKILSDLMNSILQTKLRTIITDKWRLLRDESSGSYNFGASTAYFAIDTYLTWELRSNTCQEDFCLDIFNPLKRELCPVVV